MGYMESNTKIACVAPSKVFRGSLEHFRAIPTNPPREVESIGTYALSYDIQPT